MTARRLLVPAASTFVMLIVLVALGTWQVYRLHWKEGILAQISSAEAHPAVPLAGDPLPYTKVSVTGRLLFNRAVAFGAEVRDTRAGPTMGSYQVVPLERADHSIILVNRGWVPEDRSARLDEPAGVVTVAGYVRLSERPNWFSPAGDPAARRFFSLDTEAIGAAVEITNVAPFVLVAMGPVVPGVYPAPARYLPRPPNNHFAYVLTWYGLAVVLLVIFVVWVRKGEPA